MWKLYIKMLGATDFIFIPNNEVGNTINTYRTPTSLNHRGFALMSNAVGFLSSKTFLNHINTKFKEDAEITEVLIKFEDI